MILRMVAGPLPRAPNLSQRVSSKGGPCTTLAPGRCEANPLRFVQKVTRSPRLTNSSTTHVFGTPSQPRCSQRGHYSAGGRSGKVRLSLAHSQRTTKIANADTTTTGPNIVPYVHHETHPAAPPSPITTAQRLTHRPSAPIQTPHRPPQGGPAQPRHPDPGPRRHHPAQLRGAQL